MEQIRNSILNQIDKVISALNNERLSHDSNQDAILKLKSIKNQVGQTINSAINEKRRSENVKLNYLNKVNGLDDHWKVKYDALKTEFNKLKEAQTKTSGLAQRVMIAEKKLTNIYQMITRHYGPEAERKIKYHVELL